MKIIAATEHFKIKNRFSDRNVEDFTSTLPPFYQLEAVGGCVPAKHHQF